MLDMVCACLLLLETTVPSSSAPRWPTLDAVATQEPGSRLVARLRIPSAGRQAATWQVRYRVQIDSQFTDIPVPDPVYGLDCARGMRSWSEVRGKVIERGSLTDGLDYTDATTGWHSEGLAEACQLIDLGHVRAITHMRLLAGDANHAWFLDIAASQDGRVYTPIGGLQHVSVHQRWGEIDFPVERPVRARFLRLRHHDNGKMEPTFGMPCRFSVYCGWSGEAAHVPTIGLTVESGSARVSAPAGGVGIMAITTRKPVGPGLYLVSAEIHSGTVGRTLMARVQVLPRSLTAVPADSRFGINAANGAWAPVHRRLGVGWVRFENLKWPFVSPRPGEFDFTGGVKPWQVNVDAILREYRAAGLRVLPFLFLTADYASSAPDGTPSGRRSSYPPRNPADFGAFAYQVAARYGGTKVSDADLKTTDRQTSLSLLDTYEIWNEPNLTDPGWGPWVGTAEQYYDLLRAGAESIKRADSAAKVSSCGFAGIQVRTVDGLATYRYPDGKRSLDFVDILNVHFYSGRVPPEISTDDFNARQSGELTVEQEFGKLIAWRDRVKPGMPIWLSETGYDSAGPFGTDERTQAARLPRVVMLALASGIDKVFVYRESGSTPSMHAASGLLRDDGSYKPSYSTYATLIRELDGVTGAARRLPIPDSNVRCYAWHRGSETILTAWTVNGAGVLPMDLGAATVTDSFGYRRRMDLAHGVAVGPYPIYIRGIGHMTRVRQLLAAARATEERASRRRTALAKLDAYLFRFGGAGEGATLTVGTERPYVAVLGSELYDDARGYGFVPGPSTVQKRPWMAGDLDKTMCRLTPGQQFRFRMKPGTYDLRVAVSLGGAARLTVSGLTSGERVETLAGEEPIVRFRAQVGMAPVAVGLDTYGGLRWVTAVPVLPSE